MKIIVGLGNPGKPYEHTRHNIGFDVIDALAKKWDAPLATSKFNGMYATVHRPEGKVLLVKPLTYMNLSGECVRPLMDYFDIDVKDLIVIYDDLDLGTQEFNRIRIGVSRPPTGMKVADYVLSKFSKEDNIVMADAINNSVNAIEASLSKPFLDVMSQFNGA